MSAANRNKKSRAEANRENAQKSTGPRTEEGKRKFSLNGIRHGLTGQVVVLPIDGFGILLVVSGFDEGVVGRGAFGLDALPLAVDG